MKAEADVTSRGTPGASTDLVGRVEASALETAPFDHVYLEDLFPPGDYQEDWQKRLRELRVLGWKIDPSRRKEEGRSVAYYRLKRWEPWPEGNIRQEIRRRERERGY